MTGKLYNIIHRRSFASEGTLPKATRSARKRVRERVAQGAWKTRCAPLSPSKDLTDAQ